MNDTQAPVAKQWWRRLWVQVVAAVFAVGSALLLAVVAYVAHHAEPLLRQRVVETLVERFHSPVELDSLQISVVRGLQVRGSGLRILYLAGPDQPDAQRHGAPPMVNVSKFDFRMELNDLFHMRSRVAKVHVDGMELHIPPAEQRGGLFGSSGEPSGESQQPAPKAQPKIALLVDEIVVRNMKLFVETSKPGKEPLEFDVRSMTLKNVGSMKPLLYDAEVINPKPTGMVHATGHFGPWQGAEPRATTIDGDFSFDHADLHSIKGLGGVLSSTGHFSGQLGGITVDGTTDTPDFSLDVSNQPVPLHTTFHAIVDGTTGDTTLQQVRARLLHTDFTCEGTVMRVAGKGHDIALTVNLPNGRIEDLLELGMKTSPPVMRASVAMQAKLHIPPGPVRVAAKMQLAGTLTEHNISFTNATVQDRVDSLSMRAQGRPEDAKQAGRDGHAEVASELATTFDLRQGIVSFHSIHYQVPGAVVLLDGVYSMDGSVFEFKGHVRTDATASQMVTGWKSLLLKPMDRFLKKDGAGLELPISVSGTKGDLKIGLAMGGANETPQAMAADLKAQQRARRQAQLTPPGK